MGNVAYRYDRLGRLRTGQAAIGATRLIETATYDAYGNIQQLATPGRPRPNLQPSQSNNRLQLGDTDYDAAGNLTELDLGNEQYGYAYDGANMMKHLRSDTDQARVYIYNAEDERILTFDCFALGGTSSCATQPTQLTWTLRGLGNEVLRVYDLVDDNFTWSRDYVHRGAQPLATIEPDGNGGEQTSHLHLDHLGTPRQITRSGQQVALHTYFPFGQEATSAAQNDVQLKFTGHERDKTGTGSRSELDYMHARHCSPVVGRFLSVDPAKSSKMGAPQTWNRYSYSRNSPLNYSDPDGRESAAIRQDVRIRRVVSGDITMKQYHQANLADGAAALGAAGFVAAGATAAPYLMTAAVSAYLNLSTQLTAAAIVAEFADDLTSGDSGASTMTLFTKLDGPVEAGRMLSVAVGDGAKNLATNARVGGQLFVAELPEVLVKKLRLAKLLEQRTTQMGSTIATELRISPEAMDELAKYFKRIEELPR